MYFRINMEWTFNYDKENVYHKCNINNFKLLNDELFIKYLDELFEIYNYSKKINSKLVFTINIECNTFPRIFFFKKYLKYFESFNNLLNKYVTLLKIEVTNYFSKILLKLMLFLLKPKVEYIIID